MDLIVFAPPWTLFLWENIKAFEESVQRLASVHDHGGQLVLCCSLGPRFTIARHCWKLIFRRGRIPSNLHFSDNASAFYGAEPCYILRSFRLIMHSGTPC